MIESVFGLFGAFVQGESRDTGIDESVQIEETEETEETVEIEETEEYMNSEGVEYSEADMERIEMVSEIMGEVFTDEVIANWENLSVEERTAYLNEYYARAGEALGIDTKGVYVDDLYAIHGYGTMGVNSGDGYLGIDIRIVEDPSQLAELLDTTTHEMRHQFQMDVMRNPEAFPDIPQETLEQWEYEWNYYVDPSYDFEGYWNQDIERDARAFAEEVVADYISDMENGTYSVEAYEAELQGEIPEENELEFEAPDLQAHQANFNPEGLESASEAVEFANSKSDVGTVNGLDEDQELNKASMSYTPGQCARISTGTQNYCPFAGSGR